MSGGSPSAAFGPGRLRIACAQLAARDVDKCEDALEEALDAVAAAARCGADLVVLPECSYPGYLLAGDLPASVRGDDEVVEVFAAAARRHRVAIAVGLAQRLGQPDGGRNVALLVDASGREQLRVSKRFLWDFDRGWFLPGTEAGFASIGSIATGVFVCADARMPEVPRSLAVGGARLLLDPTAWVTTGADAATLSNAQPDFLIGVRALENGTWIAAANKVGTERDAVVYCGNSGIWGPNGACVACAGSAEPELIVADIDMALAAGPPVRRKPERYATLMDPAPAALARVASPDTVRGSLRIGLVQDSTADEQAPRLRRAAPVIAALRLGLVACITRPDSEDDCGVVQVGASLGQPVLAGLADGDGAVNRCLLIEDGKVRSCATDGEGDDTWAVSKIVEADPFQFGVLLGDEGLVPEIPRILMLRGADALVWLANAGTSMAVAIARTRALENRIYVGVIIPAGAAPGAAFVADPDGRVIAAGLDGRDQLVSAFLQLNATRAKEMAPGSDVLSARQPGTYGALTATAELVQ